MTVKLFSNYDVDGQPGLCLHLNRVTVVSDVHTQTRCTSVMSFI